MCVCVKGMHDRTHAYFDCLHNSSVSAQAPPRFPHVLQDPDALAQGCTLAAFSERSAIQHLGKRHTSHLLPAEVLLCWSEYFVECTGTSLPVFMRYFILLLKGQIAVFRVASSTFRHSWSLGKMGYGEGPQ